MLRKNDNARTTPMIWTTPEIVGICVGMEVTAHVSAEIDIDI